MLRTEDQIRKRKVGRFASIRAGELGSGRVFERRRGVAEFGKAIDSTGSGQRMRDKFDPIQRRRQPVSILQRNSML